MTDLHSGGAFVLRTPALAFETWEAMAAGGDVRELCRRPEIRDALAAGAPGLLEALDRDAGDPRVDAALRRVIARMAARPTPFGLFAGWSVGKVGAGAHLELDDTARPVSRLDAEVLLRLVHRITADPGLRREAVWRANPGLYRAGGRLRYVESRPAGGRMRSRLVAVDEDDDLERVLEAARGGATWTALLAALGGSGAVRDEADAYLDDLADAQVLVPDIGFAVVGPSPAAALRRRLAASAAPAAREVVGGLDAIERILAAADADSGARAEAHAAVGARLAELGVPADPRRCVQVDLHRPSPGLRLPPAVLEELRRGVEILRRLHAPAPDPLGTFAARFSARFGSGPVPLALALDPDAGLDVDAAPPAVSALGGPPAAADGADTAAALDRLRLDLLLAAARDGRNEVELDPDRLAGLPPAALPGAFAVVAGLAAASAAAVDAGDFQVRMIGVSGPPGARLLGRFCHADSELQAVVADHLAAEAEREGDAVLAEIAHLPEVRAGNVVQRPRLRPYEIALDPVSAAAPDERLDLADLWVRLHAGRLQLWSARLGRRVLPRLTSAHDPDAEGVGLYRFLAALAADGAPGGLGWSWGPAAPAWTPRVRCGRVVLALARWTVEPAELERLRTGGRAAARQWRAARGLPRLVTLDGRDAGLPADLDTPAGVELVVRERPRALLEWWPAPDRLPVRGPQGRHVHELVVPFTRPPDPEEDHGPPLRLPEAQCLRRLVPGSGWLYAKLYAGPTVHDRLIVEELAPLARRAVAAGDAVAWHLVRYADPDPHVRVRFAGEARRLRETVQADLEAVAGDAVADGRAWRLVFDTYEREVERYGGPDGVDAAEALFAADTELVCDLLGAGRVAAAAGDRWLLGAATSLRLLLDLGVTLPEARDLLRRCRGELDAPRRRGLAAALRARRAQLEPLTAAALGRDGAPSDVVAALDRRAARIAPLAARLDLDLVGPSLVHLHLNRLLRLPAHDAEIAACDAAERMASAVLARDGVRT